MRRILLISFFLFLLSFGYAKKVDLEAIKQVGKMYYYEQLHKNNRSVSLTEIAIEQSYTLTTTKGEDFIYILNMKPKGFILVSGDDVFRPVLGYGFDQTYDPAINNQNFKSWTRSYVEEYEACVLAGVDENPEMEHLWEKYNTTDVSGMDVSIKGNRMVSPLLNCEWNQNFPYNMYCPSDDGGSGDHVYAGCVATAMSMIMYHYKYPLQGDSTYTYSPSPYGSQTANFGETTYDWDAMMGKAEGNSQQTKSAIALLMYHCGVAVSMDYGPDGSGSNSWRVPEAVETYFGYDSFTVYVEKSSAISYAIWGDIIREQIDSLQPIYYSGQSSSGGHAFVCDGYDNDNNFHFNFGWSGNQNGFYALSGMNNPVGGFNSGQAMVKNFIPNRDLYPYTTSNEKILNSPTGSIEDGSGPIKSYSPNLNRRWLIKSDSDLQPFASIKLSFIDFDLEEGNDVLTIYNGATTTSEIIAQLSGNDIPDDIEIHDSQVLITFESDASSDDYNGFLLEYFTSQLDFCGGNIEITDASGTFSDGSGELYYNNNAMCQFVIAPENASKINLSFNHFDLADQGDYLEIHQMNPTLLLAKFTGEDVPTDLVCNTGEMFVIFRSNTQGVAQGFEVEYTSETSKSNAVNLRNWNLDIDSTKEILNVSFIMEDAADVVFELVDAGGNRIHKSIMKMNGSLFYTEMELSDFPKGLYSVIIKTDLIIKTEKFIFQ
ncbi:MAG: C10 family peptidase [Bacteroidales bacterium]|nr:C10 family peptidase [Bacteroidales bacterium]